MCCCCFSYCCCATLLRHCGRLLCPDLSRRLSPAPFPAFHSARQGTVLCVRGVWDVTARASGAVAVWIWPATLLGACVCVRAVYVCVCVCVLGRRVLFAVQSVGSVLCAASSVPSCVLCAAFVCSERSAEQLPDEVFKGRRYDGWVCSALHLTTHIYLCVCVLLCICGHTSVILMTERIKSLPHPSPVCCPTLHPLTSTERERERGVWLMRGCL